MGRLALNQILTPLRAHEGRKGGTDEMMSISFPQILINKSYDSMRDQELKYKEECGNQMFYLYSHMP